MKKLMIALAAAATTMFSFGAAAEFTDSGADFEGYGDNPFNAQLDDTGTSAENRYWYTADTDADNVLSNYVNGGTAAVPIASRPEKFADDANTTFLSVETTGKLFRSAKINTQTTNEQGQAVFEQVAIPDQGIYLDTLVKFTAADDVFGADALESDIDKIAIEYVEREDDDTTPEINEALTNFVVRAGYVTGEDTVTATNYLASVPADFDKDAWHRLTVRAISNVGDGTVGFIVYLDGDMTKMLTYSTAVEAGYEGYTSGLNDFVKKNFYSTVHALFPSAVRTGGDKSNISAVAFSGNGSIDDVTFTVNKPGFIQEVTTVTVTWDTNKVTAVTLNDTDLTAEEWALGSYPIEPNNGTVTFNADFAAGYDLGVCTVSPATAGGWDDEHYAFTNLSAGAVCNIVAMFPYFEVNGKKFESVTEAVEAAENSGTSASPATIKLLTNVNKSIQVTKGYVVIDLAGNTITDAEGDGYAIYNDGANLLITNSTVEVGHVVPSTGVGTAGIAIAINAAATTIAGGVIDGVIDGAGDKDEPYLVLTAGRIYDDEYDATDNPVFYLADLVATTYEYDSDNYFQVGTVVPQPGGYDSGDGEHTFTIAADREAALESHLPAGKTLADKVSETSDLTYAQAYALGLWSENSATVEELDATISVGADGKVTVSLATVPTTGYLVQCKVYEKASLTAEWSTDPVATYAYGNEQAFTPGSATAGFYKVAVVITNALQQ